MTKDEIIKLADEAGLLNICECYASEFGFMRESNYFPELERFAALVAEAKDKEIAELAEKYQRVACAYLELSEKVKETGIKTSKWGIE